MSYLGHAWDPGHSCFLLTDNLVHPCFVASPASTAQRIPVHPPHPLLLILRLCERLAQLTRLLVLGTHVARTSVGCGSEVNRWYIRQVWEEVLHLACGRSKGSRASSRQHPRFFVSECLGTRPRLGFASGASEENFCPTPARHHHTRLVAPDPGRHQGPDNLVSSTPDTGPAPLFPVGRT